MISRTVPLLRLARRTLARFSLWICLLQVIICCLNLILFGRFTNISLIKTLKQFWPPHKSTNIIKLDYNTARIIRHNIILKYICLKMLQLKTSVRASLNSSVSPTHRSLLSLFQTEIPNHFYIKWTRFIHLLKQRI